MLRLPAEDHTGQRAQGVAQQILRSLWALQSQKSHEPLHWGCEGTLKASLAHLLNKLNKKGMEQKSGVEVTMDLWGRR